MSTPNHLHLSRRERQIIDIIYTIGEATVSQVLQQMPEPPSYTTVRTLMRLLEEKGHLKHKQDGPRYIYGPTVPKTKAQQSALHQLMDTFFNNSPTQTVAALLDLESTKLSEDEIRELETLLKQAKGQ